MRPGEGKRPPATPQRMPLREGLWFDARLAAWMPGPRALIAADLHLGYAWVQRRRGALLPLGAPDDTVDRLAALAAEYGPSLCVLLGDVVHAAADLPGVEAALAELCDRLPETAEIVVCLGNHDRRLTTLAARLGLRARFEARLELGGFTLWHGDEATPPDAPFRLGDPSPCSVIGHEHPCLALGDAAGPSVRAPCALVSPDTIVLPAFSRWAAGCVVGQRPFLGPQARAARFTHAYACLGPRLLRVPL